MNGLDPVETIESEWNDRDLRGPLLSIVDDLEALTISKHVAECRLALVVRGLIAASRDACACEDVSEVCRGFGQDNDAGVILWKPKDPSLRRWRSWIDGEIASPSAAGFGR